MNLLGDLDPKRILHAVESMHDMMRDLIASIDRNTKAQQEVAEELRAQGRPV